jgi:hypothetical protein
VVQAELRKVLDLLGRDLNLRPSAFVARFVCFVTHALLPGISNLSQNPICQHRASASLSTSGHPMRLPIAFATLRNVSPYARAHGDMQQDRRDGAVWGVPEDQARAAVRYATL